MRSVKAIFWGLLILSVSSVAYSQSVEHVATALTNISDVKVIGNYAYCAFSDGLVILDISDPTAIARISQSYLEGNGQGIDVRGNYAYLADGASGLKIFNVGEPANPVLIAGYDAPGDVMIVFVSDGYAYLACSDSMEIVDVTDPANPAFVASFGTSDSTVDIYVSGDLAYVADYYAGLFITDISDPHNPAYVGNYPTQYYINGLWVSGGYAYLATDRDLEMIDVSDPHSPSLAGYYNGEYHSVYSAGHYAFATYMIGWWWGYFGGLEIIDTSNPDSLFVVGAHVETPFANRLSVYENQAYVVWPAFLGAIDVTDPGNPILVGTYETGGFSVGTSVSGNHACVIHDEPDWGFGYNEGGLEILDVSDPYSPILEGSYDTLARANYIFFSGSYAYVTENYGSMFGDWGRLVVIDVSDPHNPVFASYVEYCPYDNTTNYHGVFVSGEYAFIGCYSDLIIEDISDPYHPSYVGECFVYGNIQGIFVSGRFAYIAQSGAGLAMVDVSDPGNPTYVGGLDTPGHAMRVYVSGDYAYVADGEAGLQVIYVSDPYNPSLAGSYVTPDTARSVFVSGNYAFLADTRSGLQVVDVSDPHNPIFAAAYATPGRSCDLFVVNNYIYLADYTGLIVLKFDPETGIEETQGPPLQFALNQNFPNPFNASTSISYSLPEASEVSIDIYDLLGRKVQELLKAKQAAGEHQILWDAGDLPSGIYFARLHAGSHSQEIRMTLLK